VYGRTKAILLLNLVSVAVSTVFLPVVWFLNLEGLAVVRGSASLLTFLLSLHLLSKSVKIGIDCETGFKAVSASAVMAVAVTVIQQVAYSRFLLPLYVATGGVTYLAMVRMLRVLNNEDVHLVQQVAGGRLAKYVAKP
ncbi:MAG: polysaccharide biosynthesis C-terminal domain-containing protein, partial [Thermoproteota archaeon]